MTQIAHIKATLKENYCLASNMQFIREYTVKLCHVAMGFFFWEIINLNADKEVYAIRGFLFLFVICCAKFGNHLIRMRLMTMTCRNKMMKKKAATIKWRYTRERERKKKWTPKVSRRTQSKLLNMIKLRMAILITVIIKRCIRTYHSFICACVKFKPQCRWWSATVRQRSNNLHCSIGCYRF